MARKIRYFQKGFNYSQDGQGNRLIYHLQGCNMVCPWCANPEGMRPEGVLFTDKDWMDDHLCPKGAIKNKVLDRSVCSGCKTRDCLDAHHRSKGIRLSYTEESTDQVFENIVRSRPMFYDGGGVTFTGGEATMQFEALKELLTRLKEAGIHTCIETNASHPRLEELFPVVDQLIMDCKHWDSEKHKAVTGISNAQALANLRKAVKSHPRVDVRIPFIGGFNNSEEDLQQFVRLFTEVGGENVTYEILKYHEFGKNKWMECGWDYAMGPEANVTMDEIKHFRSMLTEAGLTYKKS